MGCGSTKEKHVEDPKKATSAPEKAKSSAAGNRGLHLLKELQEKDGKDTKGITALLVAAGDVGPPPAAPAPVVTTEKAAEKAPATTTTAPAPTETAAFDLKTRAKVAKRGPYPVDVEAGKTYYWCTCGHSQNQPFCDGSHVAVNEKEGTTFAPVAWTAPEAKTVYFCGCKNTSTAPLCDGSHAKLPEEKAADAAAPAAEKVAEAPSAAAPAAAPGGTGLRSVDILKELADEQEGKREFKGIQLLHDVLTAPPAS
jgi:CDGSH-type Zn-finger protein